MGWSSFLGRSTHPLRILPPQPVVPCELSQAKAWSWFLSITHQLHSHIASNIARNIGGVSLPCLGSKLSASLPCNFSRNVGGVVPPPFGSKLPSSPGCHLGSQLPGSLPCNITSNNLSNVACNIGVVFFASCGTKTSKQPPRGFWD